MSWHDRPYASDDAPQPELRLQFRKPSTAVTWLIVANVAVFFLDVLSQHFDPLIAHRLLGLSLTGIHHLFLWQPITYLFMHGSVMHLLFNMLGLYIFGSEFERFFGRQRFLQFYATCGIIGGLAYLVIALLDPAYMDNPLIGASGAVYGLLIAAVIFFPHIRVVLIIFPMPIRVFALIVGGILLLQLISPGGVENLGGEVCHVAGAVTGLVIFKVWGILPTIRIGSGKGFSIFGSWEKRRQKRHEGAWARKQKELADERVKVDRILAKVHDQGLQSLTRSEKKILSRATRKQQEQDRRAGRIDQL